VDKGKKTSPRGNGPSQSGRLSIEQGKHVNTLPRERKRRAIRSRNKNDDKEGDYLWRGKGKREKMSG